MPRASGSSRAARFTTSLRRWATRSRRTGCGRSTSTDGPHAAGSPKSSVPPAWSLTCPCASWATRMTSSRPSLRPYPLTARRSSRVMWMASTGVSPSSTRSASGGICPTSTGYSAFKRCCCRVSASPCCRRRGSPRTCWLG